MLVPLAAVIVLIIVSLAGVEAAGLEAVFGIVIPYLAFIIFVAGMIWRVIDWGKSPVPFRIPTTCGQQQSLPWIKQDKLENPSTCTQTFARMILEVFFFRSLFRNLKTELHDGKVVYGSDKWLWLFAIVFHYSFLVVFIRHIRFFVGDVPDVIHILEALDSFFQVGVPLVYITGLTLTAGVLFLFLRRIVIPQVRYISLPADYFPLFLIFAIAITGILMRYFTKVDVVAVKNLTMGLVTLNPQIPQGIGSIFYVHLFLVCTLFIYFPFSKLVHMGGVFLSPTRNLANNSRMERHVNPWNYPVKVHSYEEYEHEFKDKMKKAGIPVEKE
ncbi:MAG: sulfate reduction electron transfer complex DsrMKJOP subunit DsrM [Thermodesulfovibrionales bacterium]|nr:sulfate reduction electron transfer complex DsrMKJOP subunit DsrM [Thermodesulfovibrionales bacterium]